MEATKFEDASKAKEPSEEASLPSEVFPLGSSQLSPEQRSHQCLGVMEKGKKLVFPFRELIEAEPPEVGGRVAVPEKAREATRGWG